MARTPMSAPGNRREVAGWRACAGFTLLELLLVVALIAMVGAGVAFSLRETGDQQLEREAQRLAAMLDAARAQSRATGVSVVWQADDDGFTFSGLQSEQVPHTPWLAPGTSVRESLPVVLGPDPIIERQQIELVLGARSLRIATDGLRPFAVQGGEVDTGAAARP